MLPSVLVVLGAIWIVLSIVFEFFVPPDTGGKWPAKPLIALLLIALVLVCWFVAPVGLGFVKG